MAAKVTALAMPTVLRDRRITVGSGGRSRKSGGEAFGADVAAAIVAALGSSVIAAAPGHRGLCEPAAGCACRPSGVRLRRRSEEHTSALQSLMRISYAVFCLKKKKKNKQLSN